MVRPENASPRLLAEDEEAMKLLREFTDLLGRRTAEQRCEIVYRIVRGWLGDDPQQEVPLEDPDGLTYAYIVPVQRRDELVERSEEQWIKRLEQGREETGRDVPVDELTRRLERIRANYLVHPAGAAESSAQRDVNG